MSLNKRHVGMQGDECQCGRRASIAHCTECGSFRTYGYAKGEIVWTPQGNKEFKKYRCQTCGHIFTDRDREFCTAPVYTTNEALARMQIQRAIAARDGGQPLTDKEEVIMQAVTDTIQSPKESTTTEHKEYEISFEQERAWRLEWAKLRLVGKKTTDTVDAYLYQKASMLDVGSKKGE